jgi:Kelch motif
MAQQALPAGRATTRNRAMFGLLDARGWGWASVKAVFWFILIIFLLGYIPDRAYYFVVNRTIDIGILAWSPINFCPPENETLPCPAPVGAAVPWEIAPEQIYLPEPRTDGVVSQSGTRLLFVGGRNDAGEPTDTTFVSTVSGPGNFAEWEVGPPLPEARADAAVAFSGGTIFVAGGYGPDGDPTSQVYVLTTSGQTGELGEWQRADETGLDIELPHPMAGAVLMPATDGLFIVGGTEDGTTPTKEVWKTTFDRSGRLGPWVKQADLFTEVMDHSAALIGDYMWVYGGTSASGPTRTVQRGEFGTAEQQQLTTLVRFGVRGGSTDLPEPRTNAAGFSASGALYLVGGSDGTAPQTEMYWALPDGSGNIPEWKHLPQSDLPESSGGIEGSAPIALGPDAVLIGGQTSNGVVAGAARANLAPQEPFFQLGLVGATVPALKIDGEIGQQLGYLAANSVGIGNFVILLIVGWAFAHKEKVAELRDNFRERRARR